MIVIFISAIDQGTGSIKLFMLSIVLNVLIDFQPSSLLAAVEGIGRYSYIRYFNAYQMFQSMFSREVLLVWK